jgi:hypothetical protein
VYQLRSCFGRQHRKQFRHCRLRGHKVAQEDTRLSNDLSFRL